jgi:hypothetical protein
VVEKLRGEISHHLNRRRGFFQVSHQTKVAPQRRIAMWEVKELVMEKYVHQIPSQRQWDE